MPLQVIDCEHALRINLLNTSGATLSRSRALDEETGSPDAFRLTACRDSVNSSACAFRDRRRSAHEIGSIEVSHPIEVNGGGC